MRTAGRIQSYLFCKSAAPSSEAPCSALRQLFAPGGKSKNSLMTQEPLTHLEQALTLWWEDQTPTAAAETAKLHRGAAAYPESDSVRF